jgi:hypothetical protein
MKIRKWLGLRNNVARERMKPGDLDSALNIDLDDDQKPTVRDGTTQLLSGACHSLWGDGRIMLYAQGSSLYRLYPDGSTVLIRSGLLGQGPLSFASHGDFVCYSNGLDTGIVERGASRPWGIAPPRRQPAAEAAAGHLPPGLYLYAMTFVDADGRESGTGPAGVFELFEPGGIEFYEMEVSTNPAVTGKMVYLSTPGGEVMYQAGLVSNAVQSTVYSNDSLDMGSPLATQFGRHAPAGEIVALWNGYAFVVQGDAVYYSEPYNYELFKVGTSFLRADGAITLFQPMKEGIFLGTTEKVLFLRGTRPDQLRPEPAASTGAIPGTGARCGAHVVGDGTQAGDAVMWTGQDGVWVGFDNGAARNMTQQRISLPVTARGAGMVRQVNGFTQYVTSLQGAGEALNANSKGE